MIEELSVFQQAVMEIAGAIEDHVDGARGFLLIVETEEGDSMCVAGAQPDGLEVDQRWIHEMLSKAFEAHTDPLAETQHLHLSIGPEPPV